VDRPAHPGGVAGVSTVVEAALGPATSTAEEKVAVATQLQLTWWRFRRHKVAVASAFVVAFFYLVALLANFLATSDPHATEAGRSYIPPQEIHWFDDGSFRPYVFALKGKRDMKTFKLIYAPDPDDRRYLTLFAHGYPYEFLGLFTTDRHLN
jgi:peptide/nickel transport system permease protein